MKQCIKPLYESKSDYEICRLVAERLGVEREYTEGNTVEDWIRKLFNVSSLPEVVSFEEFKEKVTTFSNFLMSGNGTPV